MTTFYQPPPTAHDLMKSVAEWIARVYRVRVVFTITESGSTFSTTTIDRRPCVVKEDQKP